MELDTLFIEKLYKKDEETVTIFLNEFKIPLYNYIYRLVYNRHDAEDILQEVFLKIFKNIKRIDFLQNYKSFIYKVARNSSLDFLQKRKKEYELHEKTIETEDVSYERLETKDRIEKALQGISEEEREIIILKYIQGLKISDISEILKISESTIKVRIFRIIRKMRKYMQDEESVR
jgi:RNA polymerase sigma-70 factor (ECF subfamily)